MVRAGNYRSDQAVLASLGPPAMGRPPRPPRSQHDDEESGLAQQDPAHTVLGVLGQDQGGPATGRSDVLAQVDQVDALPDLVRPSQGHVVGDLGEAPEVGARLGEGRVLESEEPVQVPAADVARVGVDVDREVDEVAHRQGRGPQPRPPRGGLEDVEPFQDQDVGALHRDVPSRHDVVDRVGVDRRLDALAAGLHGRHEVQQGAAVVGLGEAPAGHEAALLKYPVGQQETVGGHQVHSGRVRETGEQVGDESRRRRLADGDRSGHRDDEGRRWLVHPQEGAGAVRALARGGDVVLQQRGQRAIDGIHLGQVDRVSQTPQLLDVGLGQRQWRRGCQGGPLVAVQLDIGRGTWDTQVARSAQLGDHRHSVAKRGALRTISENRSGLGGVSAGYRLGYQP